MQIYNLVLLLIIIPSSCLALFVPPHDNPIKVSITNNRRAIIHTFSTTAASLLFSENAVAAPPIAIIAQELGYFPVTNRSGETVYIPATVRRRSSEQSIKLAQHLKKIGSKMYGAYWCPHCSHQKELFGREAWDIIDYVECSSKGYSYNEKEVTRIKDKITGFPTWKIGSNWISGEMSLDRIVALSGYKGSFDPVLEGPDVASSGACR